MVNLQCRHCGAEVASDEKARKCKNCGDLFPFVCAVCDKHLRPPIPDFPVERYFNDVGQPLCADHYQRQCPECNRWFRADENPGFFMCPDCTAKREAGAAAESSSKPDSDDENEFEEDGDQDETAAPQRRGCGAASLLFLIAIIGLFWSAGHQLWAAWPLAR